MSTSNLKIGLAFVALIAAATLFLILGVTSHILADFAILVFIVALPLYAYAAILIKTKSFDKTNEIMKFWNM